MHLKKINGQLINVAEIIPDLLLLAQNSSETDITPAGNSLCWCQSITIENYKSRQRYAHLWFNRSKYTHMVSIKLKNDL